MPGPEQERMDALTEAILRLLRRVDTVEARLSAIEQSLGMTVPMPAQRPAETPAQPPFPRPEPPAPQPPAVAPIPEPASQPATEVEPPPRAFETRLGLTWLNRIGVITLVLGVAFFFKYAVDNKWIGERGRVSLGVLAGLAALAAGEWMWRRGQRIFGQGISGAGFAILYVSLYAAYGYYALLPHAAAFALMALNTAAAGALAWRYDSPAMAALGLVGGYVTPVVLSTGEDRPWALFGYVALLDAGALAMARLRNWQVLEPIGFAATVALYWGWIAEFHVSNKAAANLFALLYFALFTAGRSRPVGAAALANAMVALAVVSMPDALPYLPLALGLCACGLLTAATRGRSETALTGFLSFWLVYAPAHFVLKEHARPELVFAFLTAIFVLYALWTSLGIHLRAAAGSAQQLVLAVLNAAAYFTAAYDLLERPYRAYVGLFAVSLALVHVALAREARHRAALAIVYSGIALCFVTLAIPIEFVGYRITMGWSLEAAALAWIGARRSERRLTWTALGVFALALLRLITVDTFMYPAPGVYAAIWNARFLTFIVSVSALWAAAAWARRRGEAVAMYLAGHFALLWALTLEVLAWGERTASAPDVHNLQSAAVSILLAAYAVCLVAAGVVRGFALDRILGLALIGAVVAKLYLYDVWQISRGIYRVAAFAALGVFLLLTSYLYSRFRRSIEIWWRESRGK